MQARGAHPARTVVLLPYAQLMPHAARLWARSHAQGFAPRFETTHNWCRSLGAFEAEPTDFCFDPALDVLTARTLLEQAGQGAQAEATTPLLLGAAQELAPLAAAVSPDQRAAWAARARSAALTGMSGHMLALEAAVAQLAIVWVAHSSFVSDVLFAPQTRQGVDCLLVVPGIQPDPLLSALQRTWGDRMAVLALDDEGAAREPCSATLALHAARDAQDEAQRAAACVLRHIQAGRTPVALVVSDRALTRRVRALLGSQNIQIRDETGWKLSTSRAGAHLMGALRACAWNASSDAVLDWLKNAPALATGTVTALESALRRQPQRLWRNAVAKLPMQADSPANADATLTALLADVLSWRAELQGARTLTQWLTALRQLLQRSGQWTLLQDDVAGAAVLAALRLDPNTAALPVDAPWARRRLDLPEFTRWADQVLEAHSFRPDYPAQEQVVILPLAQLLGRPFGAVVMPACDEVRLNPSPDGLSLWTAAQRLALGLPGREQQEAALRAAWRNALTAPQVDVLWRTSDEGGEPLLPSPLVQALRLPGAVALAQDPRAWRELAATPVRRPAPAAPQLPVSRLSASAYQDLRHCPYRFFALRQLGLQEVEEMEGALDKRDFGLWLHAVLKVFHDQLCSTATGDAAELSVRRGLLDAAARDVAQAQGLAEDEFLAFHAAWPRLRDGYLDWLREHEALGLHFREGERWQEQALGSFSLVGRIDRIDDDVRVQPGDSAGLMLIDYKTEALQTTRDRVKQPLEDTQLAFYAALLSPPGTGESTLRAAYVNLGEREGSKTVEQDDLIAARDALRAGMVSDMARIAQGAGLPALGEGAVCDYCAARGLCRRDFWPDEALQRCAAEEAS